MKKTLFAGFASVVAAAALVAGATHSAFSGTTNNGTNTWATGSVTLTDNDSGQALFTVPAVAPNQTDSKCITVTYSGTSPAKVRLYSTVSGDLGTYLNFKVEIGSGDSTGGSCSAFTSTATLYNGTLAGLGTTYTNYSTGLLSSPGEWGVGGVTGTTYTGAAKTFRFTYTMQDNNAAQGKSASANLIWEAQNA